MSTESNYGALVCTPQDTLGVEHVSLFPSKKSRDLFLQGARSVKTESTVLFVKLPEELDPLARWVHPSLMRSRADELWDMKLSGENPPSKSILDMATDFLGSQSVEDAQDIAARVTGSYRNTTCPKHRLLRKLADIIVLQSQRLQHKKDCIEAGWEVQRMREEHAGQGKSLVDMQRRILKEMDQPLVVDGPSSKALLCRLLKEQAAEMGGL